MTPAELSDHDLLARFRAGDGGALEALFVRYEGPVFRFLFGVLRDHHAAEDAFQATFLILARKAGGVRGSVPAWLHRVARRVAARAAKQARPMSRLAADPPAPVVPPPDFALRDTIVVLANGAAADGQPEIDEEADKVAYEVFKEELTAFAADLAKLVVRDGEGATKFVTVSVEVSALASYAY